MRRPTAAAGSALFFAAAPAVVAGVIPYLLTEGWQTGADWWPPVRVVGGILTAVSAAVLIQAFARFVVEGLGTPAPVAPTEQLVVGGPYRYVRNVMYLAVTAAVAGQALLLCRSGLLLYAALVWALMAVFARFYEEPVLARRYGAQYEAYRRAVPAWLPRLRRQSRR